MLVLRGQKRYMWHKGEMGPPRGCRGIRGHKGASCGVTGVGDVRCVFGAGRQCRYSEAR